MEYEGEMNTEEKAAYNQAASITVDLGVLRKNYIAAMHYGDLNSALRSIRDILAVISPKINQDDLKEIITNEVYILEDNLPLATATFIYEGKKFYRNPLLRKKIQRLIEMLFIKIRKLEDQSGFGMPSLNDPRFAVLNR